MLSTATPTWSMAVSTAPPRISSGLLRAGRCRLAGRLGRRRRQAEMDTGAAVGRGDRRSGHDAVDLLALEHLVAQQRAGELVELGAVTPQEFGGGAEGLVGEFADLLVADPPG